MFVYFLWEVYSWGYSHTWSFPLLPVEFYCAMSKASLMLSMLLERVISHEELSQKVLL